MAQRVPALITGVFLTHVSFSSSEHFIPREDKHLYVHFTILYDY